MAFCSFVIQCQAFAHPTHNPATSSASVQACVPGCRLSSHRPSQAPNRVGKQTDQPITPNIPRPDQTCACLCRACSLRFSCAPTARLKDCVADYRVGSFSGTLQLDE